MPSAEATWAFRNADSVKAAAETASPDARRTGFRVRNSLTKASTISTNAPIKAVAPNRG